MASASAKALAFGGLVTIQTGVGIIYKLSSRTSKNGKTYSFSPASAVAMAEFVKFCISLVWHLMDHSAAVKGDGAGEANKGDGEGGAHADAPEVDEKGFAGTWRRAMAQVREQLSQTSVLHIQSLAALYCLNNQLQLQVIVPLVHPSTMYLFKAGGTLLVAIFQLVCEGKMLGGTQWALLMVQMGGVVMVQWDPCAGKAIHESRAYAFLCVSSLITAWSTVRNAYMIKNYKIALQVQNMVLYAGGFVMNTLCYFLLDTSGVGFFEGYNSPSAIGVVVTNSLIGVAITAVYKYADAMTKMFAQDTTTVLLTAFSVAFLGQKGTLLVGVGVGTVLVCVHAYTEVGRLMKAAGEEPPSREECLQSVGLGCLTTSGESRQRTIYVAIAAVVTVSLIFTYNSELMGGTALPEQPDNR